MKIFISNNRSNADLAERLVTELESQGHEVFYYIRDIETGKIWLSDEQNRGLTQADVVIALISDGYMASKFCRMELDHAFSHDKLYPVLVSSTDLGQWDTIQYLDVTQAYVDNDLDHIIEAFQLDFDSWLNGDPRPLGDSGNPARFEDGEVGIVFARFAGASGIEEHWHLRLRSMLQELIEENGLRFHIVSQIVVTIDQAHALLARYNASLVIWGTYLPKSDEFLDPKLEVNYTVRGLSVPFVLPRRSLIVNDSGTGTDETIVNTETFRLFMRDGGDVPYIAKLLQSLALCTSEPVDYVSALVLAKEALHEAERKPFAVNLTALYRLCGGLCTEIQPDEALTYLDKAVQLSPKLAEVHYTRMLAHIRLGMIRPAFDDARTWVTLEPNDPFAWIQLGQIYRLAQHFKEALGCYQKALQLDPEWAPYLSLEHGVIALAQGHVEEGEEFLLEASSYEQYRPAALLNLAMLYHKLGTEYLENARTYLEELVDWMPQVNRAKVVLSEVLFELDQQDEALNLLADALEHAKNLGITSPVKIGYRANIGGLMNIDLAREPTISEICSTLGAMFALTGRWEAASEAINDGFVHNPNLVERLSLVSLRLELRYRDGLYQEAEKDCLWLIEHLGVSYPAWFTMAAIRARQTDAAGCSSYLSSMRAAFAQGLEDAGLPLSPSHLKMVANDLATFADPEFFVRPHNADIRAYFIQMTKE